MVTLGLILFPASPGWYTADEDDMARYLFIDGEFFRILVDEMKDVARPEYGELEVDLSMVGHGYDRVFYYDAYPEKKDGQQDDEFESEVVNTRNYFDRISTTRNFSVRPALTRRGHRRQQKGVDVLLAIECLMHAIRNNIDEATIMTSDLDFFPLFEALLQTKTKSVLRYQLGKTSFELIQAADFAEPVTFFDFNSWIPADRRPVKGTHGISNENRPPSEKVASGTVADKFIELMKYGDVERYFAVVDGRVMGNAANSRFYVEGQVEKVMRAKINFDEQAG